MRTGWEAAPAVSEGDIVAEKYRVERVLGVGGMGMVVAARHIELDELVAIKFLLPDLLRDPGAVARFQREAKAAVRIKGEHVARVLDVGRLPNGAPYMVMEYLEGADLASLLQQGGPLPVHQAVDFVVQACVAVADAHALGIVHRDLKPANLFCIRRSDGTPTIKVLDFGISKVADVRAVAGSLTHTSAVMGSPIYMSPEQMRSSKNVDARTDIWALGAVLFELLTARAPFEGTSVTELAVRVATDPTPLARMLRPDLPQQLDAVIGRCLEKMPDARYRDVSQLAHALVPFAPASARAAADRISGILSVSGSAEHVPQAAPLTQTTTIVATAPAVGWTDPGRAPARSSRPIWAVAAALAITGVVSASLVLRNVPERNVEPPSAHSAPSGIISEPAVTQQPASPAPTVDSPVTATVAEVHDGAAPRAFSAAVGSSARAPGARTPSSSSPKNKAPHAPAPAAPAAAQAAPNCDPPFYFDGQGNRIFKQECL